MQFILDLTSQSVMQVFISVTHNWPYLLGSVLIATLLPFWVNAGKVSAFLKRHRKAGVAVATAAAVTTPLCSCGTTAVVLGMMAGTTTWAPIVAFMVASPLSSPEGLVYSAGLFGWPFAIVFFAASVILGLGGGWIASVFERRGWLSNQARFKSQPVAAASAPACGCSQEPPKPTSRGISFGAFARSFSKNGLRLLGMFLGFAFIGFFLNGLIPQGWVNGVFGAGTRYGVPLAATLGLPLYVNSEGALSLIRGLLDAGMSQGAAMAFLICGAGTSIGAIAGALTIARWRVVGLVVAVLWVGAVFAGFAFNAGVAMQLV